MEETPLFPLDHLALRGAPNAPALLLRDRAIDYEGLNVRISRLAFWLKAQVGETGARVATWTVKDITACLMPLAAVRAGLVHVPVNPQLKHAQVAHILADSGAKLLIANTARLSGMGEGDVPEGCALADLADVEAVIEGNGGQLPPLPADTDPDTLAAILYTSGSTGRPKGVTLSHANLVLGALSVSSYLKLRPDDVTLAVMPLSFDYGQNQLLNSWCAGAAVAPLDFLMGRDVVKACAKFGVTTIPCVPPLWVQLVEQDWPEESKASVRRLTNTGGALTPSLVKQLRALFPQADLYAMYGLTEAFRSTYLDPSLIDTHPTSIGKEIPHAEILVVRPDGSATDDGEPGELVHAGPLVAIGGYWQDPERTAIRYKPAPAHSRYGGTAVWSGDTVMRDKDGLIYFVGRDDAMIKTSGNRVSPTEIEEAAVESGLVAEACAIGVPDSRLGAAIMLYVRGGEEDAVATLAAKLKAELPGFMQPKWIERVVSFPLNANGKIDRVAMATEAKSKATA